MSRSMVIGCGGQALPTVVRLVWQLSIFTDPAVTKFVTAASFLPLPV
ncbi:hypothetical protein OGM63_09495 [Plectonema radiosum NIES-515]|uniref:Uncharacterized protein n=1 Tax=Plectonema radiosum NIES-515 TaxID=2986073 RepID=A0ABT3AX87_9CYAN|nr:hypothetical protein [Plectonema radiosum]MCV3213742.1 hypothetical protein [Plectonema radiosum NIES-515]